MNNIIHYIYATFFPSIGIALALTISPVAYGVDNGEASLIFHMALSHQQIVEVHATVENTGDIPIERGYIVVSSRDAKCKSNGDIFKSFAHIPVRGKIPVVISLPASSAGYLVTSFQAFDDLNFPVLTHDRTTDVVKGREKVVRSECVISRGASEK